MFIPCRYADASGAGNNVYEFVSYHFDSESKAIIHVLGFYFFPNDLGNRLKPLESLKKQNAQLVCLHQIL